MARPAKAATVRQPARDPVYKDIYGHAFMVAELLRLLLAQSPAGLALLAALDLSSLERGCLSSRCPSDTAPVPGTWFGG